MTRSKNGVLGENGPKYNFPYNHIVSDTKVMMQISLPFPEISISKQTNNQTIKQTHPCSDYEYLMYIDCDVIGKQP